MNQIVPLNFEGSSVRTVVIDGAPWFVAMDVCAVLKIAAVDVAVRKLDSTEKGPYSIRTPGGLQELTVISESGLYALVLRCRNAMMHGTVPYRFRKWVTSEVLPTIRKTPPCL